MAKPARDRIGAGEINDLSVAVGQLNQEVGLLRRAVDELRDDVIWAARQVLSAGDAVSPGYLSRRPTDPLAPDATPFGSAEFNDAGIEVFEAAEYCCKRPRLTWHSDPDAPGIVCENCGYVVAEQGSVAIWREPHAEPSANAVTLPPTNSLRRQSSLFD